MNVWRVDVLRNQIVLGDSSPGPKWFDAVEYDEHDHYGQRIKRWVFVSNTNRCATKSRKGFGLSRPT
jgi:hypothetical protein